MKEDQSGIQGTTFFGISNCGNIEGMKVIFFSKSLKFLGHLKYAIMSPGRVLCFEDKCVGTCYRNFCLL